MKALRISLVAGAALCDVMSTPASAMPISNLAAVASDLAMYAMDTGRITAMAITYRGRSPASTGGLITATIGATNGGLY